MERTPVLGRREKLATELMFKYNVQPDPFPSGKSHTDYLFWYTNVKIREL